MAYIQVTRAQFRALLIERLGSLGLTFYRTTELNFIIQEGLRFWNLLTGFWKTRATITTVAGQVWYSLPTPITSNLRVTWQSLPLSPATLHDMGFGRQGWRAETTTSGGDVPSGVKLYIIGAINLVAIWPQDAAGNSQLDVDGIANTPRLTSDSSTMDIGQEELKSLLDYCEHVAVSKQGGKEFADSQRLFKNFLKAAGERSAILRASTTYRRYLGLDRHRYQHKVMDENVGVGAR